MQEYFVNEKLSDQAIIRVDKDTYKHMFSVMRLKDKQEVILVGTDGIKWRSQIISASEGTLIPVEALLDNVELPNPVTLALGFTKGDKLDLVTQKATELGASAIWGFPAEWSVVKWDARKCQKKAEKLAKISQGAAQQSKRNYVPQVQLFDQKEDLLERVADFDHVLLAYEEIAKTGELSSLVSCLDLVTKGQTILVIVGPEGGISPDELETFIALGAKPVGLGPRILRAETAPLYLLSALSFALELGR